MRGLLSKTLLAGLILFFSVANTQPGDPVDAAIQALVDEDQYKAAFRYAEKAANSDEPAAQEWLGWFYDNGLGVEPDTQKAAYHYRLAANAGQNYSRWRLGVMIDQGNAPGTLEDAYSLFQMAADADFTNAMVSMAVMQALGRGTDQDYEAALANYMRAARAGNPNGTRGVGVHFALGQGVPQDLAEAAAWFLVGAASGDSQSNDNLSAVTDGISDEEMSAIVDRADAIAQELGIEVTIVFKPSKQPA